MTRRSILVGLALLSVACALLWALLHQGEGQPAWTAEFFDNVNLQGPVVASRVYPQIDFVWGDGAPVPALAVDAFSARLDTCLTLPEPLRVAFHLASDDGARLFVDGTIVIDHWDVHAWGTKSGHALLEAGRHHLRIDYFEAGGDAALYLASNPPILDAAHLVAPAQPFMSPDPCAPVK